MASTCTYLYHTGVGISRVALITQFHHSTEGIYVEAVDSYSWEAFVAPQSALGDDILQLINLQLTVWDLRFCQRILYICEGYDSWPQHFSWTYVPKMILKSVSSCYSEVCHLSSRAEICPLSLSQCLGFFLTERAGWRWWTIYLLVFLLCYSVVLVVGTQPHTGRKEKQPLVALTSGTFFSHLTGPCCRRRRWLLSVTPRQHHRLK